MADRYWVGGGGTWNNNSGGRWSYYSGGPGGYGNPGVYDNAIFDANSGGGSVNVATGRVCYNLLLNGFTGTLTGAQTTDLVVYGDTITLTGSSGVSMPGNGPRLYINTGYSSNNVNFYSYGSTIGNLYISGRNVYLQQHAASKNNTTIDINNGGALYLNGYDLTTGILTNSNGTLNLGTGTLQILQAGPPNSVPTAFQQSSTLSATSGTLRFTRARVGAALSSAINSTDTTLTLVDAYLDNNQTVWPSAATIQIDNEILSYSSISSGVKSVTLSGLTRGLYYSGAASHNQYAPVLLLGPYTTTLSSAANSGDTTLYVVDNSQFPGNGYIEVGGEIVAFTGKSGTTAFTGCTRGQIAYGGTSAAYHAAGTIVRHMEGRTINFTAASTLGLIEFGTNGGYMATTINGTPTFSGNNLRAGPYLPTNPFGMQALNFTGFNAGNVIETFNSSISFTYNGTTGVTYIGGGDDDSFGVTLPFNVYFFGTGTQTLIAYNQIYVGTNGYITFGASMGGYIGIPYNCGVPHIKYLSGDRLASIYTRDLGNGTFIIWASGYDYSDYGDTWVYELHLYQNQSYYDIYVPQAPYAGETTYAGGNGVNIYPNTFNLYTGAAVRLTLTAPTSSIPINLDGQRGIQGLPSQPVYIKGLGTGTNTSTRIYTTSTYPGPPDMPYTYVGTPDFIDNFY